MCLFVLESELWFLNKRILPASFVAEIECPVRGIKLTDFFIFLYSKEDFRKEFQEQNPDIKSMRDVCYGLKTQNLI